MSAKLFRIAIALSIIQVLWPGITRAFLLIVLAVIADGLELLQELIDALIQVIQ